jgi:hypothetical protein
MNNNNKAFLQMPMQKCTAETILRSVAASSVLSASSLGHNGTQEG